MVKQDDRMDTAGGEEHYPAIYFLKGGGSCKVKVRDHMGRERVQPTIIGNGDHFGEVALVFDCARSATVISEDYNTFARLELGRFRQVIAEYPEWEDHLRQSAIKSYRD